MKWLSRQREAATQEKKRNGISPQNLRRLVPEHSWQINYQFACITWYRNPENEILWNVPILIYLHLGSNTSTHKIILFPKYSEINSRSVNLWSSGPLQGFHGICGPLALSFKALNPPKSATPTASRISASHFRFAGGCLSEPVNRGRFRAAARPEEEEESSVDFRSPCGPWGQHTSLPCHPRRGILFRKLQLRLTKRFQHSQNQPLSYSLRELAPASAAPPNRTESQHHVDGGSSSLCPLLLQL